MAIKGQKFKTYSEELKMEAIRLHVEEKVFGNLDAGGKEQRFKLIEQGADIGQVAEHCQLLRVSISDRSLTSMGKGMETTRRLLYTEDDEI